VWHGGGRSEAALLARAYESAFAKAKEAGDVRSIAFPALSTGAYRFPKPDAASIALRSMVAHDGEYERIVACLYDEADAQLYRETLVILRRAR
jgi:O-acetyl-ADP-ribose deacetylase (regulator of RNase III)